MAGVSKTAILRECSIIQYLVIFWKYVHWIWMWGYKTDHNFKIFNLNSIKNKHYFQLTSHGVISILMLSWKEGHIRRLTEYIEMEFSSHIIIRLDQFLIKWEYFLEKLASSGPGRGILSRVQMHSWLDFTQV